VSTRTAGQFREVSDDIRVSEIADSDHGVQVLLRVEGESFAVDSAVEVNGELREAQERPGAHQGGRAVVEHESSSEFELSIEPRIEEWGPIDLDPGL